MSIWTESFPVGKKFVSRGRTITEGDFSLLHNLTWSLTEVHTDREYMNKKSQFGERLFAGPCLLACSVGLASVSGLSQEAVRPPGFKAVAILGFDNLRFSNPVKPGDTITVHSEVLDIRPTSRNPKRALLRIKLVTLNQKGQQVMEVIQLAMVEKVE